jgi:hypothetical protein
MRKPPKVKDAMLNVLKEAYKILDSYQKFNNKVIMETTKFCDPIKNWLARTVLTFRLPSRSNNGKKFLAITTIVSKWEIHFFLGHKNEETSNIKIPMVEDQCIINKPSKFLSLSF